MLEIKSFWKLHWQTMHQETVAPEPTFCLLLGWCLVYDTM